MKKTLDRLYENCPEKPLKPPILILSDLHMGDGGGSDDFKANSGIYLALLREYFPKGHTLVLLGDIEELWEDDLVDILLTYPEIFSWHKKFHQEGRLIKIVGNHDIFLEERKFFARAKAVLRKRGLEELYDLLPPPSLPALKMKLEEGEIFLFHGHQLDFLSNALWKLSRFFVRYLWKPIQIMLRVSTASPAKGSRKRRALEREYYKWAEKRRKVIVCGHTHRAMFASSIGKQETTGEVYRMSLPVYFNSGCGIYTDGKITAIEISHGKIRLLAFYLQDGKLKAEVLGEDSLSKIFKSVYPQKP